MEKSKQSMSGLPMVVENLKAIKVLVADALQDYCYIENAADGAKYNFKRISASMDYHQQSNGKSGRKCNNSIIP